MAVAQALLENMLVCGGGSGAPGTGVRLLREVGAAPACSTPVMAFHNSSAAAMPGLPSVLLLLRALDLHRAT